MAPSGSEAAAPRGCASRLIHRCVRDPGRPADVTPSCWASSRQVQRRPHHDSRLICSPRQPTGLRSPAATRPLAWPCSGRYLALGAGWARKACPSARSTRRVGLPASAMNLAFRRDAGERPPRGAYGGRSRLCRRTVCRRMPELGYRFRPRKGGSRRRCYGSAGLLHRCRYATL